MANRFDWESRDRWEDERRNRMAGNDHVRGGYSGEFGRDRWDRSGNIGAGTPRGYQSNEDMRGDRRTHDWEVGDRHYHHYNDRDQNETYGRSRWQDGQGNPSPSGADWFTSQDYGQGIGAWGGRTSYPSGGAGYGAGYSGRGAYRDDDPRGFVDRAVDEVRSWFGDDGAERRREQDHRGRGPSDYTRTDERIREDANDRLTDHPWIDARQISVSVTEGEVTLTGTVGSRSDKRRAEDCVDDVSGVKHVQNNLRVATTGSADNREEAREGGTLGWGVGGTPVA